MHFKKITILAVICALGAITPATVLAASSSAIQKEIDTYKEELSESQAESESLESQISSLQEEVGALYSEIEALNIQKQEYIDAMSERITYFYEEESNNNLITSLLGAGSIADMLSIVEQQNALHEYDAEKLDEYEALVEEIAQKQEDLDAQVDTLCSLLDEQEALQAELEDTISEKEEELAAAKKKEASASSSSSFQYAMSSSGGVLTKSKGVVYYNGHRETYYSQRVLPGNGLNIPGRHVDPTDGTVRDGDGYICVASSDLAKGTVVETSLGTGKVYDCGCASGTIDVYTDW